MISSARVRRARRGFRCLALLILASAGIGGAVVAAQESAQPRSQRSLEVADLFALESVRAIRWSPDGTGVAYEVHSTEGDLAPRQIGSRLHVWQTGGDAIDLSALAGGRATWGAAWSPGGASLALLVADPDAAVRLAMWDPDNGLHEVADVDVRLVLGGAPLHWVDDRSLIVTAWPDGAQRSGGLYQSRTRGERAADLWAQRRQGSVSATVLDTADATGVDPEPTPTRLVRYSLDTDVAHEVHRGRVHQLSAAPGGRHAAYFAPSPGIPTETVDSFLRHEELYSPANWGTALVVVDLHDGRVVGGPLPLLDPDYGSVQWSPAGDRLTVAGAPANAPDGPRLATWDGGALTHAEPGEPDDEAAAAAWLGLNTEPPAPARPDPATPPSANATVLSVSGTGITLFREHDDQGDRLLASVPAGDADADYTVLWEGNHWVPRIAIPAAHRIDYVSETGQDLTGWLLTPPGDGPFPTLVMVYPGAVFGDGPPFEFTQVQAHFLSPLLFVARGYAVLAPSIPDGDLFTGDPIDELTSGVLPALDAAIATGHVDPDRLVVQGQSGGGYAALGLIGKTDRFRAAIASASYSDLESLYGTFYGQMRYGDGGHPQRGQVLRITQMERGFLRMGGPPWELPDRYRHNSPITYAPQMTTPLLLIHGDLDFIPIQQAEQMFTALYRLGRDVRFLRYHGEWHTVGARANVEHMWTEIDAWLERQLGPV